MPASRSTDVPPPGPDATPGRPGRPRRFGATEEQQRLLDAAFEVIRAKGYGEATVADILAEAGMSTRSFYRHFSSKDELLQALFRRDAEAFAAAVTRRVEAAPAPVEALEVWIDEILAFGLDRARAQRAAVLGSEEAMRSLPAGELGRALDRLTEPLARVLAGGPRMGRSSPMPPPTRSW